MKKWLPWILTLFFAAWIVSELRAPKDKSYQFAEFGRLPVVANGRFQPMDSLARNALLQLREKQSVYVPFTAEELQQRSGIKRMMDVTNREMPAIEWLSELIFAPEKADTRKVFRVDHPEVRSMLKLPEKDEASGEDGKHYSWNQFTNSLEIMQKESKRVGEIDSSHRTPFDQAVAKTHKRLVTYMQLKNMVQPQDARDFSAELADYSAIIVPGVAAIRAQQAGKEYDQPLYERFLTYAQRFDAMARMEPPLVVPPHHPEKERDAWMRMGEALLEMARGEPQHPAALAYATMASSFRQGKVADFNQAVLQYRGFLETGFAPELKKTAREQVYNRLQAFYHSMVIYVVAFLLAVFSWFNLSEALRKSAAKLIGLALFIHTAGLIFRMVLEGRPPVTNLYSSAIFIGWGAVILGMILERFYKDGIGSVVASSMGFITLIVAHNLSLDGDTMEMMRAVLDTNFWLATHVVVVTLGYASTFVAGFLAIVYIVRGVFTSGLSEATGKSLARMIYGICCFATLFSFVGTVLGGIWADQSWGRFWGWDPKENGALIIVLWNALILHARWGGLVRERGLVNMAIFGNVVTSWSWFGVNMLGIGLHSYGFMDAAFRWLMIFVVSQVVLILLGMMPLRFWASFRNRPKDVPPPATPRGGKPPDKLAPAGA